MIDNLLDKDKFNLLEISKVYKEKKLSPVELIEYILHRIEEKDQDLNSYITVCSEAAREEAKIAEKEILNGSIKSPLHGIPIAVKDLIYTKNVKTTMGSGAFKNFITSYDATVITRLRDAGAIIIGKTNTHEIAYGPTGDYSFFGPTRNPYDPTKMSGGSSSGSGASVAQYLTVGALGTDTGGSV